MAPYGVRCNAIAPGFILTEMMDAIPEDKKEEYIKHIPEGRFGSVDDVANLVLTLCDDKLSYVTGQVITIDGGLSL